MVSLRCAFLRDTLPCTSDNTATGRDEDCPFSIPEMKSRIVMEVIQLEFVIFRMLIKYLRVFDLFSMFLGQAKMCLRPVRKQGFRATTLSFREYKKYKLYNLFSNVKYCVVKYGLL
jgi:hypothetical protein